MPLKICCPQGHKFLLQDNLAGNRIACPTCRTPIDVPAAEQMHVAVEVPPSQVFTEPEEAEILPEPSRGKSLSSIRKAPKVDKRREKQKEAQGLQLVGIGFLLLGFAMVLLGLGMAMAFLGTIAVLAGGGLTNIGVSMNGLGIGSGFLAVLLDFVGIALLFAVPARAGARWILVVCVLFSVLSFSPPLLRFLQVLTGDWGPITYGVLVLLLWMAQKITLFMYVQAVANFIRAEGYSSDVQGLMLQTVLLPLVTAGVMVLGALITPIPFVGSILALTMLLIVIVFWVLYGIRYCKLMFDLRNDVS